MRAQVGPSRVALAGTARVPAVQKPVLERPSPQQAVGFPKNRRKALMSKKIPVISLFSGAMGLDLGLEKAGFRTVLAVECDAQAVETIRLNRPNLPVLHRKIEDLTVEEILKAARLKVGGDFVVSGGPSCQAFSTAGQRRSFNDPRGSLFAHYVRVVREAKPKFFVMENVKGLLSAAVKHRPLNRRGAGFSRLRPEEELGSAFRVVVETLKQLGYHTIFDVLNSADFGVPQTRERLIFIGSRDGKPIRMPLPTHAKEASEGRRSWVSVREAIGHLRERRPEGLPLYRLHKRYLKLIPPGGNWKDLPRALQHHALGKAYRSWGGRSGFYRRLDWDKPSPALTTVPTSKATMLCHPTRLRPLSLKEYARIQQFPDRWRFGGTVTSQYRQIGNAVPVGLGAAIGKAVRTAWKARANRRLLGEVKTHNADLVRRLSQAPRTVLNPPRMRRKVAQTPHWQGILRSTRDYAAVYGALAAAY